MAYRSTILADNPIAYLRLGESSGTIMEDVLGDHHGTYVGAPGLGQVGALTDDPNTAVAFDGTSAQYGKVAAWTTVPNKPVSLECWAQWDGETFGGDTSLGGWLHQSGVMACQLFTTFSDPVINIRIGTENGNANAQAQTLLADSAWLHVVGTIDSGGQARIYFNGELAGGPSAVTFAGGASDNPFKVGTMGADGSEDSWPGTIDEWAVYDYALTAGQVAAHYAEGTSPTPPPAVTTLDMTRSYENAYVRDINNVRTNDTTWTCPVDSEVIPYQLGVVHMRTAHGDCLNAGADAVCEV